MSRERAGAFFRGRELAGLLVYVAILLIGWPVLIQYARPKPEPEPRSTAVDPRPLRPETGPEFSGLVDKTPLGFRDNAAYLNLLQAARADVAANRDGEFRRDVLFTHLWQRPDLYRGVAIDLEGTLLRTLVHESMNPSSAPAGRLYEGWFVTSESRPAPYVVVFEETPRGFELSPELSVRVRVRARFLKLLGYRAGDAPRAAPLLIGRIELTGTLSVENKQASQGTYAEYLPYLLIALFVYLTARVTLRVVRATRRSPRTRAAMSTSTEPPPEALSAWLEDLSGPVANDSRETPSEGSRRSDS